ncbi:MAG: hypothetical protein U0X73_02905 [Thermoanaerobaculia bacterium]
MNPRLLRLLAVALAALVVFLAWRWWGSEERRLWSRLGELESAFAKSGEERQLAAAARTKSVVDLFAPGFSISAAPYEGRIEDREQLAGIVYRYRQGATRIAVSDGERELEIRANGSAEMRCVITVRGDGASGPGVERFRVRFAWRLDGGVWRISEVEILERLESSGLGF